MRPRTILVPAGIRYPATAFREHVVPAGTTPSTLEYLDRAPQLPHIRRRQSVVGELGHLLQDSRLETGIAAQRLREYAIVVAVVSWPANMEISSSLAMSVSSRGVGSVAAISWCISGASNSGLARQSHTTFKRNACRFAWVGTRRGELTSELRTKPHESSAGRPDPVRCYGNGPVAQSSKAALLFDP